MSTYDNLRPDEHQQLIQFHERKLELHGDDLPPDSRRHHEQALVGLRAVDPYEQIIAGLRSQLDGPLLIAERAILEAELQAAEIAQAGAQLWRTDLGDEERLCWTQRHRLLTTDADHRTPSDIAESSQQGVFMSERATRYAEPVRPPSPIKGMTAAEYQDRCRRLAEIRRCAEEHEHLRQLAEDLPLRDAERALGLLELEQADETRTLDLGLSERERAGAELLRRDREHTALLNKQAEDIRRFSDQLNAVAGPAPAEEVMQLTEGTAYEQVDGHGCRLLCVDSSIFDQIPKPTRQ